MSNTTNDDLVRVGTLGAALYNSSDEEAEILGPKFEEEMSRLNPAISFLVMTVVSLVNKRAASFDTNSADNAARFRSLAEHMGATVTERQSPWGQDRTALVARLQARH